MTATGMARVHQVLAEPEGQCRREPDQKVIGYWCTLVPVEMVTAAGMTPYLIHGDAGETPKAAEGILTHHMCGWMRSCFAAGVGGRYDFLDGLVVPHACNNMDPMHSLWKRYTRVSYVTLLSTPHIVSPATSTFFREELLRFKKQLEQASGKAVSQADLRHAVAAHNSLRRALRKLSTMKRMQPSPLSGTEMLKVAKAAYILPPDEAEALVTEVIVEVERRKPAHNGRRVMVYTMDLDSPEMLQLVEDCGSSTVMGYFCPDARTYWYDVPETADPFEGLVEYYLGTVLCSRLYENAVDRSLALVKGLCRDFNVQGCIYIVYRYCDTFESDVPLLKEAVAKDGVPGLVLEMDYSMTALGSLKTRVEAFVESLQQDA